MQLVISVPGEPIGQGRPRFTRQGGFVRAYDPPESVAWKRDARRVMLRAMTRAGLRLPDGSPALLEGPLVVAVIAVFACPKSDYRKTPRPRRPHLSAPDEDNVGKIVKDALKGTVIVDDRLIAEGNVRKIIGAQGEPARVVVCVTQGITRAMRALLEPPLVRLLGP